MVKVLIVKLSSMGDVICTLPAVTDAKNAVPDVIFDWVVEESFTEIPGWHPAIRSIIPFALRRWRKSLWRSATIREISSFCQKVREECYDYICDAQGLLKSGVVSRIARGMSCGFNEFGAREPLASYIYHKKFDVSKKLHAVERVRRLFAEILGYKIEMGNPSYGIRQERFRKDSDSNFKDLNKYLVFIHGTSRSNKCWQEEKWIRLAQLAEESGIKVKLPWGNEEEYARAKNIANAVSNAEVLPELTLAEMAEVLLGASFVIALDTGFSHLDAALNIPTVTLYGPTNPLLAGTYGKNQIHLTNMTSLDPSVVWQRVQEQSKFIKTAQF